MALQLTLEAMGVTGGEVIVPALTFVSTGLAALRNGCRVIFADIDEDTLCLDWADVAAKRTPRTRAVIPVWYAGRKSLPWVQHYAALRGLRIIEDCAHAAGTPGAGLAGDAGCWSFHAVKNLACGDGGMVTTDDGDLAAKVRALRWCGIDKSTWARDQGRYGWDYDIPVPGWKAHMNDLAAAIGLVQLARLEEMNEARRRLARAYLAELKDLDWLRLPEYQENCSWHLLAVRTAARDALVDHLLAAGVSAGVHYKPLNAYPWFGARQILPVTDRVWRTLVTLPLFPDMTQAEQEQVIEAVRSFRPPRGTERGTW
jgi:perosamine synthetase